MESSCADAFPKESNYSIKTCNDTGFIFFLSPKSILINFSEILLVSVRLVLSMT